MYFWNYRLRIQIMVRFPNCKINLGLYITNRREDGYHDLETVFYPVNLCDVLEIVPAAHTDIYMHGKEVQGEKQSNLVWKAYQLLKNKYPEKVSGLAIHLLKNIPMGAGLGGGSADGAFMLSILNDHYTLGLDKEALSEIALQLGSDCPFFIYNTPHFAKGRGEQMSPVAIDLSDYTIQLVYPQVHMSTAAAFGMITPKPTIFDLKQLHTLPVKEWKQHISNDFEEPIFTSHPELRTIKEKLYAQGAIYASMSGSGSTLYGIFEKGNKTTLDLPVEILQYTI